MVSVLLVVKVAFDSGCWLLGLLGVTRPWRTPRIIHLINPTPAIQVQKENKRVQKLDRRRAKRLEMADAGWDENRQPLCDLTDQHLRLAAQGKRPIDEKCFVIELKGKVRKGVEKQRHHMTSRGQMVSAVRKSLGNVAAADFGKLLMCDISNDSFLRAEVVLGATRIASMQAFHDLNERCLLSNSGLEFPPVAVHSFSHSLSSDGWGLRCNTRSEVPGWSQAHSNFHGFIANNIN